MSVISSMFNSNNPKVEGKVSIKTEVFSFAFDLRSSISISPSSVVFTVTDSNPAIDAEAGFVPWAESGINATVFSFIPLIFWYSLAINNPAYSPWAPARGANDTPGNPVISPNSSCNS